MDLAEKFRLFKKQTASRSMEQLNRNHYAIDTVLNGHYEDTPFGRCFVTDSVYPLPYYHGNVTLNPRFAQYPGILEIFGLTECTEDTSFVFLDTETTGLSRGTGTYVFLVGVGQYCGDTFIVRQYFLEDLPEESSLLFLVNDILKQGTVLVTYNGKSFDIPLLHTRLICLKMDTDIQSLQHLDLLHLSRRFWKERIGSCALSNVESRILEVERSGDIPGALIPSLYFDYLQSRDARALRSVFYHNTQDVLSLAALLNRLVWTMDIEQGCKAKQEPDDYYEAGRVYEDAGDLNAAEACYNMALASKCDKHVKHRTLWSLSMLLKRQERLDEAVAIWERLLDHNLQSGVAPYIELAKYYEHKTKDYKNANYMVCRAIQVLENRSALLRKRNDTYRQDLLALRHRLNRIKRKLDALGDELKQ
jgi:uncharacterized protein YprB with RNaseH-like and TPR domain